jgi:hypothetical protein
MILADCCLRGAGCERLERRVGRGLVVCRRAVRPLGVGWSLGRLGRTQGRSQDHLFSVFPFFFFQGWLSFLALPFCPILSTRRLSLSTRRRLIGRPVGWLIRGHHPHHQQVVGDPIEVRFAGPLVRVGELPRPISGRAGRASRGEDKTTGDHASCDRRTAQGH